MSGRGLFAVFEGGEGSGKSTVAAAVARRFEEDGVRLVFTREPGGTEAGERIRALLHEPLSPWAETFAFLVARAQLVAEVIGEAMESGMLVICDRFEASTFAYQGFGRGLPLDRLREANEFATGGLHPDLTIFLDIDPAAGLARKAGESESVATGREALAFHRRVREGYLSQLEAAPPGTWLRIDAARPLEDVVNDAHGWLARALVGH